MASLSGATSLKSQQDLLGTISFKAFHFTV